MLCIVVLFLFSFFVKYNYNMRKKILFKKDTDQFLLTLNKAVKEAFSKKDFVNANLLLWFKLFFYLTIFLGAIAILYLNPYGDNYILLVCNYILIGASGTFLAFNSAHDACHGSFGKKKWVNGIIYHFIFNMNGISARLWQIRHLDSHHLFPNVDGCDADIDDNPLIRFSPNHRIRPLMKYQHIYAAFLYSFYLVIWIYAKDFFYLKKKDLANLINQQHPWWYTLELWLVKIVYLLYIVIIPIYLLDFSVSQILFAYLLMLMVDSNIFIHTLISTHFAMETKFPSIDEEGVLPYSYAQHQLETSLDYYPRSSFANFIFGGFNAHAAHHLFPDLPHTLYPKISSIIEPIAKEFGYTYNKLTLLTAIASHFRYLKMMGRPLEK